MSLFAQLDQQPDLSWLVTATLSPTAPALADCPPGRIFVQVPDGLKLLPGTKWDGTQFIIPAPVILPPPVDQAALLVKIAAKLGVT